MSRTRWQFWIDRGGTFTDIVARAPDGSLQTLKLLSDNAPHYDDAAVEGIRRLLGLQAGESIDPATVEVVKMGTTVATNALLERRGARTVLVITRGFRDALRIGTQARPRLFDRHIVLPEPIYERVLEACERIGAGGEIIAELDAADLRRALVQTFDDGIRACAIVFMHGYRFPVHELAAAEIARACGFNQISVSHRVSPLIKLIPRGDTTVVDAYLSPVLRHYVRQTAERLAGIRLFFMQSSGALAEADHFHGKDAILSGPAGGIVGMVQSARAAGHERLIGFDMGGTSTDVSHFAGHYERAFDTVVAGVRVRVPMMAMQTIAAGGGSIVDFDGARLRVGPASAGANPGPACYRRGGPATITDANVVLGRLQAALFPRVFGPSGGEPLDAAAAGARFGQLAEQMSARLGRPIAAEEVAAGSIAIAVGSMANAVKRISVARGYDVTRYTLQCFGGAAGQHACAVADALGMQHVFCHPLAGVLSAYGMGLAHRGAMREASLELPLDAGLEAARALAARLEAENCAELGAQGVAMREIQSVTQLLVRYRGTDTALACALPEAVTPDAAARSAVRSEFERAYRQRFAFLLPQGELIIEAITLESTVPGAALPRRGARNTVLYTPQPQALISMFCGADSSAAAWRPAALYDRDTLLAGAAIDGPAIIVDRNAATVIDPGWHAAMSGEGNLELHRTGPRRTTHAAVRDGERGSVQVGDRVCDRFDPVMLEVFNNLFMSIAEQMGLRLQNTAHSVNIKERLDFSCALFDAAGALIANAPHMPVHLGSMSESIESIIRRNPSMQPGDVFALNDPYHGGTHLPDITVVTPVFLGRRTPVFFVASRGHHADIGGITPGSMPPFSTRIEEEGVLIDNLKIAADCALNEALVRKLLSGGEHPARNPDQNVADLRAQVAANEKGVQELSAMVEQYGLDTVARYMQHVQDNAEECVRRVITALHDGEFMLALDNGAEIHVAVRVDAAKRSACIDFSGTSAQTIDNFNAPRAITVAAVLYVFRTLVDDDIPLNAGCLKPLEIIVPAGCLLNPQHPAAVVAGNVETSTCVTNALYGALGVMAASQCTMNNFTFGNARYQYYETVAGGAGAGAGCAGASVVQTHMTNSRLTDPEILEVRYPVRLEAFEIRAGSGGAGQWPGGNGAERRVRFLEPMTAAILSNGRSTRAFGMAGGGPGAAGENLVMRADGRIDHLGATGETVVEAGDVFVVRTPGGGGYGKPT